MLAELCDKKITLRGDTKKPETILMPEYEHKYRVVSRKQSHYRTMNQDVSITFLPLYEIADDRYTVYVPVQK
jgi:starvation-inducible outer membrane lipoprotein